MTYDAVYYNLENISSQELVFENHFQALALQMCGRISKRCIYPDMLQCGFSYFGLKICPCQLNRKCDGHIDRKSNLEPMKWDAEENLVEGCSFEVMLNILGTSIKEINIDNINTKVNMEEIFMVIQKYNLKY